MTTLTRQDLPHYSVKDYLLWEGDWELIQGVPYAMSPSPVKRHQSLVLALGAALMQALDDCPDCEVLIDEDWRLDDHTVLRPDVAVVCGDANPDYIGIPPHIVIEVLSPATRQRDENLKFRLYEEQGVGYYLIVDPDGPSAKIYHLESGCYVLMNKPVTEAIRFDGDCPLELDLSAVFVRLRR